MLLEETGLEIRPGVASRRGNYVVYVNGAEEVSDLLAYMGASGCRLGVDSGQNGEGSPQQRKPENEF